MKEIYRIEITGEFRELDFTNIEDENASQLIRIYRTHEEFYIKRDPKGWTKESLLDFIEGLDTICGVSMLEINGNQIVLSGYDERGQVSATVPFTFESIVTQTCSWDSLKFMNITCRKHAIKPKITKYIEDNDEDIYR